MIDPFLPMLAVPGEPFDSPEHLFEVKWDGVRAVAAVEQGGYRVWGRDLIDYGPRYPELEVLRRLPSGTVVDGELVVLQEGRARLEAILRRHQLTGIRKIEQASRQSPVTYVVFDLVQWQGQAIFDQPLRLRRSSPVGRMRSGSSPTSTARCGACSLLASFAQSGAVESRSNSAPPRIGIFTDELIWLMSLAVAILVAGHQVHSGKPRWLGRSCSLTGPSWQGTVPNARRLSMVAPRKRTPRWHRVFLAMLPAIRRCASHAFRSLRPEAREDAIVEVISNACVATHRLAKQGKLDLAYPTVLAGYGIRQTLDHRRVGNRRSISDVLSPYCQEQKHVRVSRLDRYDEEEGG